MRKFLIAAAAITAISAGSASAADLAARPYTKAPVYAAPVYNWTGFYVGAHIGAAFGGDNGVNIDPLFAGIPVSSDNKSSFLGGGQVGADYQFAPNWVVGIEGQISGLSDNTRTITATGFGFLTDKNDWLASVTGRLGYTWGPGLIYAKGGVAFRDNGGFGLFNTVGAPLPYSVDRNDVGYTVGGGLEYLFAPSWSAKVEYQYYNFDRTTVVATGIGTLGNYESDVHTVKVGVNYRFNWAGPVVAKY